MDRSPNGSSGTSFVKITTPIGPMIGLADRQQQITRDYIVVNELNRARISQPEERASLVASLSLIASEMRLAIHPSDPLI